jgi:hypothetical protein
MRSVESIEREWWSTSVSHSQMVPLFGRVVVGRSHFRLRPLWCRSLLLQSIV